MDFSSPANLLLAGIYYLFVAVLSFFAIFSVYVLVRYGRSRLLSLIVSLLFTGLFLVALSNTYTIFQSLQ